MTSRAPELDNLIGELVSGAERDWLAHVHEALVRAGPAPELPSTLSPPPTVGMRMATTLGAPGADGGG